jgi:hypothetical protein
LVADLRAAASAPQAQILLPIDQGEELFAWADSHERDGFVRFLAAVLSPSLPVQVLMTIRADAMASLQALPSLAGTLETLPIGPLSIDRYREIIEGPAMLVGLTPEPAFVERSIRDTATEDALPLLAFALKQLYDRHRAGGHLSLNHYLALGAGLSPLENVVQQAATEALTPPPSEAAMAALRDAFVPAMVRLNEHGTFSRRAAPWHELPTAAQPLLESLVEARLLVRRQLPGEPSTVEVAHEALLRAWPPLQRWLEEAREFLLAMDRIQAEYRADEGLLRGPRLASARRWLAERPEAIRPELRDYIQRSLAQERARQTRTLLAGFGIAGLFGIAAFGVLALIRGQPALYATLLTNRALLTHSTSDITAALQALHVQRRKLLEARFPNNVDIANPPPRALAALTALNCTNSRADAEFCQAERRVNHLLSLPQAPFNLPQLKVQLQARSFGQRYYAPSTMEPTGRFTPGALRYTVQLLFDARGAGADLPNGSSGALNYDQQAWMIPCRLLIRIEEAWRQATAQHCSLFHTAANGEIDALMSEDPACMALASTSNPNRADQSNSSIRMRTLGWWFFDDDSWRVAKRYQQGCLARKPD